MGFGWSKARVSPIAIDFGADALKLLRVTAGDPPQLVAAASQTVPEEARNAPAARQAFYFDALRDLLRQYPFRGKRAICAIPAYQTLIQHLPVSNKADANDMEEQVGQLLRQRLNINPSRMVMRSHAVPGLVREGGKAEVICMAASRDVVMRHIASVNKCKLDVVGMHCEPMMILRAFQHLFRRANDSELTTCFLDIGAATTKVVIAHGSQMVFAKAIHVAGDHVTREYAQAHDLTFSDARTARIAAQSAEPGLTFEDSPDVPRATTREAAGRRVRSVVDVASPVVAAVADGSPETVVEPMAMSDLSQEADEDDADVIDCLVDDLRLCVRYHEAAWPKRPIDRMVFVGGEAKHLNNCRRIAEGLNIAAQLGHPLARLSCVEGAAEQLGIDTSQCQPGWAVPMGLCLSEANL